MRKTRFVEGKYYHLFNRGVDKRLVFSTRGDFERFKAYLYLLNDEESPRASNFFKGDQQKDVFGSARSAPLVGIGAYSLMPTHFHLLLTPLTENGIPKFMQKLLTAYTMYFNERTLRTGSLFSGTYKSMHADTDEYLKHVFAFIHLNSSAYFHDDWQQAEETELRLLERNIITYPYSSASEYFKSQFVITSPEHFPRFLSRAKNMQTHLNFWLKLRESEGERLLGKE